MLLRTRLVGLRLREDLDAETHAVLTDRQDRGLASNDPAMLVVRSAAERTHDRILERNVYWKIARHPTVGLRRRFLHAARVARGCRSGVIPGLAQSRVTPPTLGAWQSKTGSWLGSGATLAPTSEANGAAGLHKIGLARGDRLRTLAAGGRQGALTIGCASPHWDDRLDEIQLGRRSSADRTQIEAELKEAAADLLRGHS
jgi:hypothetical protein